MNELTAADERRIERRARWNVYMGNARIPRTARCHTERVAAWRVILRPACWLMALFDPYARRVGGHEWVGHCHFSLCTACGAELTIGQRGQFSCQWGTSKGKV